MRKNLPSAWTRAGLIVLGSFLFAAGMNWFITPLQLFSGGGVGLAQLLTTLLEKAVEIDGGNLYGIVYLLINLPLFVLAWRSMGRRFFVRTVLGAGGISLFITLLPTVTVPIVEDYLTSVLIGGLVTGVGNGLILVGGGCGGGIDIIGVWAAKKYKGASVGKISLAFNALLYAVLLLMYDVHTVIYSLIYMVFFTLAMDKAHYQNITVRLMVFTKEEGIDRKLTAQTGRGVTEWSGVGAYTGEGTHVLISCTSKYEMHDFIEIIHSIDPNAFIIADENVYVAGNFEKRI